MKKRLIKLIAGAVLLVAAAVMTITDPVLEAVSFLIPYLIVGYRVLLKAVRNIANGKVFSWRWLPWELSLWEIIRKLWQ